MLRDEGGRTAIIGGDLMSCARRQDEGGGDGGGDGTDRTDMMPRPPQQPSREASNGRRVREAARPAGAVHVPGGQTVAPLMRSPDYVQISTAAAITLGIVPGRLFRCSCTRCLNLLLTYPEGCRANCAYCGLARHREERDDYADRNFIRVDWPALRVDDLVMRVAAQGAATPFHRMCISMITHPRSESDTFAILKAWTDRISPADVPVSILSNPTTMTRADVARLDGLGAQIFTVALDAATPGIFERTRGRGVASPHAWAKYWEILEAAADIFGPGRFGAHIIVGMGETEREVLQLVQRLVDMGGHSHMFCFYPERGSLMDHLPATPRDQWRRVQLARYLIDHRGVRIEHMRFDAHDRVVHFGVREAELLDIIAQGIAFRTSGCPGKERDDVSACDRPYGDSPPSDIASYPFEPGPVDLKRIRQQLGRARPGETYREGDELDAAWEEDRQ